MSIEPRLLCSYPKLYYKRNIEGYESPYQDPFEYRSIRDIAIPDEVYRVIASTAHRTSIKDVTGRGKHEFNYLVDWAGEAFDPAVWYLAYLNSELIGFVFPQLYGDVKELGSVWHIGTLEHARGHGYGKILHAHALETLNLLGAKNYTGSTEPENYAMRRIFEANGCVCSSYRIIEEFENGFGRAL